jgi:hypothetical protein
MSLEDAPVASRARPNVTLTKPARRERRHPKASTQQEAPALDPLENTIGVDRSLRIASANVAVGGKPAVTGRLGVRLLEFGRTRAFWLETVARRNLKLAVNLRLADHDCVKRVLDFCETLACPRQRVIV